MGNRERKENSLRQFWEKIQPGLQKTGKIFRGIGRWIYRLRGLLMAIPVALIALWQAGENLARLPGSVGLLILENGQYYMTVSRLEAVTWPLVLTGACLVLMFCSRRIVYPWLISLFTLVIPIVIYITNIFPA